SRAYSASIPLAAWYLTPVVLKPRSGRGLAPTTRRIITSSQLSSWQPAAASSIGLRSGHGIRRDEAGRSGLGAASLQRAHRPRRHEGVEGKSKAKSVVLTDEGARVAEELFRRHFGKAV